MPGPLKSATSRPTPHPPVQPPVAVPGDVPGAVNALAQRQHASGDRHARAGRWKRAVTDFAEALRLAPDAPHFHYTYGFALGRVGRLDEAMAAFRRALELAPDDTFSKAELGVCLAKAGRTREAIPVLIEALSRQPNMPVVQFSLAVSLLTEKRARDAIMSFDRVLSLHGAYTSAYRLRGLAFALEGETERALDDFNAAAALESKSSEAMLRLGAKFGQKDRGLQAGYLFEMAARTTPDAALPQFMFGHFLLLNRRFELGLRYVERAITMEPGQARYHHARGFGLLSQGRVEEAVDAYRHAMTLDPQSAEAAGDLLFVLQHKPGVIEEELFDAHRQWAALAQPVAPRPRHAFTNDCSRNRKLKIGIISADMHRHAVAYLTLRAFEELAARGIEIICYNSNAHCPEDDFCQRFKALAAKWINVAGLNDDALRAAVEADGIDILFDLAGHTSGNRIPVFAMRAAPVQVSWAGYVGTIGLDTYDGLIADPVEVPIGRDAFYAEPVVRLPDCYVCYQPPEPAPEVGPLPCLAAGHVTFGCFNRPAKINTQVARVWARILDQMPDARLLLAYGGLNETGTREALTRVLSSGGIDMARVELVGESDQARLLAAYAERVDLALDPFPYSGGVTTLEAMWMGVPVVTRVGDTFAGRHSATHLTAAGLADFCARSDDAYVEIALSWARRPEALGALRAGLRGQMLRSPLTDQARFADHLEAAMRHLWHGWCDTLPSAESEPG